VCVISCHSDIGTDVIGLGALCRPGGGCPSAWVLIGVHVPLAGVRAGARYGRDLEVWGWFFGFEEVLQSYNLSQVGGT